MRIVFFVHRYWPSVGGVEKYIHELAKALVAMGHQVDVVAGATTEGLSEREVHDDITVHRFPALRSPLRARGWFLSHLGLFRRADVIHISNTHVLEYYRRMIGRLIAKRKVFLTRHGLSYIYPVPESEKRRAVRSRKWVSAVVHDGAFIEKWLGVEADLCPDQGLAPPADELTPVPEPTGAAARSAVFVGRLEPDSGIGIYLDAMRNLMNPHAMASCGQTGHGGAAAEGGAFRLDVYGDGSRRTPLRERVEHEHLPVTFHGRCPDAQRHFTDGCFAFVDGRMAIQEAMARRRLIFAAYVDPLKRDYVAGESFSPYLIAVASGRELASAVTYYLERPIERAGLVQRAFEHARSLTWKRTAQAYLNLWEEKLSGVLGSRQEHKGLEARQAGWRTHPSKIRVSL